jgi:hypothetical protein
VAIASRGLSLARLLPLVAPFERQAVTMVRTKINRQDVF